LLPSALLGVGGGLGIYNEETDNTPSNSDQAAGTITEFEYCIENYNATANTTYYFSFNDYLAGQVPLYSGKSYPSLTTASAYDLTIDAPLVVELGDWELGSSAYASYTFGTDEEITIRDNRGQTSGNSTGWTCTAAMSTELTDVITASNISAPAFSGSGFDNMTINGGAYFTGTTTTYYKVEIDRVGKPTDTFKWSDDGGSTWDGIGVPCAAGATLNNGVIIDFATPAGHVVGDYWTFTATPEVANIITKDNMYFITNTIVGIFDAPITNINGISDYMDGAGVAAATVSGSAKQGLGGFQLKPTLRIYNANTVGEYEGAITFTLT
jgi:hypothetical protein